MEFKLTAVATSRVPTPSPALDFQLVGHSHVAEPAPGEFPM